MNTERLLELAAHIETLPHSPITVKSWEDKPTAFNMGTWHCGAVCCIGGWAEALFIHNKRHRDGSSTAAWALGLDELIGEQLFYPSEDCGWRPELAYADITPAMAAAVIRSLVETGEVSWAPVARMIEAQRAA